MTTNELAPIAPHAYVSTGVSHWRTCAVCGQGANAQVHRAAPASDVELLTAQITETDERVAMLYEMTLACHEIAERYGRPSEVAGLHELLAEAMRGLNGAIKAAFDAGLTSEQIDNAAKRWGTSRDALSQL